MDITKITDKFIAALDDHGYEDYYTRDAVESIVKTSLERKAHLIELFRTSKKWDEDQLCIHFDHDVERKTEPMAYSRFLRFLSRETHNQIEALYTSFARRCRHFFRYPVASFVTGSR